MMIQIFHGIDIRLYDLIFNSANMSGVTHIITKRLHDSK